MQDSEYLGDLGGLSAVRRLLMLDPRGTGASAAPQDPETYRCDHLADDVEALREHLELDRMDLLAHSAGANHPTASAALDSIAAGGGVAEDWEAMAPFFYGRWDDAAQAHKAAGDGRQNEEAAAIFRAGAISDRDAIRAALATFEAPTLFLAGELDLNTPPAQAAEFAALFPHADLVVQPNAAHFPWLDDSDRFVSTTAAFLATDPGGDVG